MVYRNGEMLRNVLWVDSDAKQWSDVESPMAMFFGVEKEAVHQARRIVVDQAGWRVDVDAPEIPPEVHNPRAVSPERAMAAVRAMCQGTK
jgi:hypothetical protein